MARPVDNLICVLLSLNRVDTFPDVCALNIVEETPVKLDNIVLLLIKALAADLVGTDRKDR